MTVTILGDPDVFVQWEKVDEPGQNPRWISQCGEVEQIAFGDNPLFQGYIKGMPTNTPKAVLSVVKKDMETVYQKYYGDLKWAYEGYQD